MNTDEIIVQVSIVDDSEMEIDKISKIIRSFDNRLIVSSRRNAMTMKDGIDLMLQNYEKVQLLILDMLLSETDMTQNGIELLRQLKEIKGGEHPFKVICVSAEKDFGFILANQKDNYPEILGVACKRPIPIGGQGKRVEFKDQLTRLIEMYWELWGSKEIIRVYDIDNRERYLHWNEMYFIEANVGTSIIHRREDNFEVKESFGSFIEQWNNRSDCAQVHRSFFASFPKIESVDYRRKGNILLKNGASVGLGESYKKVFKEKYSRWVAD